MQRATWNMGDLHYADMQTAGMALAEMAQWTHERGLAGVV